MEKSEEKEDKEPVNWQAEDDPFIFSPLEWEELVWLCEDVRAESFEDGLTRKIS